jgi:predicted dehydrogenase
MAMRLNRRELLRNSTLASVGLWLGSRNASGQTVSPNEKLNVAVIGCGGRGAANLAGVAKENIVALCDVDERRAAEAFKKFPQAKKFRDFRKMLAEMDKQIDAVVVSTPDHTHAPAAMLAMRMGKHCYCEKPLAHEIYEVRQMAELAKQKKLATQMGTQIHAGDNYRRVVELIQAGTIGPVHEVYCWMSRQKDTGQQPDRPQDTPACPAELDWDLWLGPAPKRPYHPTYVPGKWRAWWDFGTGTLGDFGCHLMDLPFWALGLRYPLTVEAEGPAPHPESSARAVKVTWTFPARQKSPPVKLVWCHGMDLPPILQREDLPKKAPGILFVGESGMVMAHYDWRILLPADKFKDFKAPEPTIPRSVGHHQEWIDACTTGRRTTCDFDYSGALTEAVLLGVVAFRSGKKFEWDPVNLRAIGCPEADRFLRRQYRPGWEI